MRAAATCLASVAALLAAPVTFGATIRHVEPLQLTWGDIDFFENGTLAREQGWFAQAPPHFTNSAIPPQVQTCLSNSFLVCTGTVASALVWRINRDALLQFMDKAIASGCIDPANATFSALPPDGENGDTVSWNFGFRFTPVEVAPAAPASIEVALQVADVPFGTAWRIPVLAALQNTGVLAYAKLPAGADSALATNQAALHLFLAPMELRAPPAFPRVEDRADFSGYEIPIAYGLRAMAEALMILGPERSFTADAAKRLQGRLSPASAESFDEAEFWFPESDRVRMELGRPTISTGSSPADLLRVGFVTGSGPDRLERVLPTNNHWAIRAGPFRRMTAPEARVFEVRIGTNRVAVTNLVSSVPNPKRRASLSNDISSVEAVMRQKALARAPQEPFFWLPAVRRPHAVTIRSLERTRYVEAVSAEFVTNRLDYLGRYAPFPVRFKVGINYSTERGFGAAAESAITGFPFPGDEFSLSGSISEELKKGALNYSLPYYRSLDRRTEFNLRFIGELGDDDHFRLGNLTEDPFTHRYGVAGIEHQISRSFNRWSFITRESLMWEDHELDAAPVRLPDEDSGLLLSHAQEWRFRPDISTNASVAWRYSATPRFTWAPALGWDRDFWKAELGLGMEAAFGGEERDAMYVRVNGAGGLGSRDITPALLYRLGDINRMLGLEPGEFAGTSFAHGQLLYGVGLQTLLGGLLNSSNRLAGILSSLDLQAIAEVGAAFDRSRFSTDEQDDVVSSYGIGLETRTGTAAGGPAVQLGYAWSPDSVRRGGRIFTAINWAF
jgi:hypothetical protein